MDTATRVTTGRFNVTEFIVERTKGLAQIPTEDIALVRRALAEVKAVMSESVKELRSSNRHFFIGLPYPLNRRSGPVFDVDNESLRNTVDVMRAVMTAFFGKERMKKWICNPHLNVIVRNYSKRQNIAFHKDKPFFNEEVMGVVLENTYPDGAGLQFRLGRNVTSPTATLKEKQGMCFCLQRDSRWKWAHGFTPAYNEYATRTSMSIRFYDQSQARSVTQCRRELASGTYEQKRRSLF